MTMFSQYKTDPELERQGVWTDYGTYRVRIAFAGGANTAFERLTTATFKPHQRALKAGTMDKKLLTSLSQMVASKTIVTGWQVAKPEKDGNYEEGPFQTHEDGEYVWEDAIHAPEGGVVPFGDENVLKTFKLLPHLYEDILGVASEINAYRVALREEASGN